MYDKAGFWKYLFQPLLGTFSQANSNQQIFSHVFGPFYLKINRFQCTPIENILFVKVDPHYIYRGKKKFHFQNIELWAPKDAKFYIDFKKIN
jgi:hypothetical protein